MIDTEKQISETVWAMAEALTPTQIVKWFREQARVFNQMADTVENTFKAASAKDTATLPLPTMGTVTVEQVKLLVAKKAMRIADIAKHFSVERYEIEKIVSDANVFNKGQMGWITLKK